MKRVHTGVALVLLALSVSLFLSGASLARHLSAKASLPDFTGPVQCVYVDPGNGWVYAGTYLGAGVYRSTDNGETWHEYGTGLPRIGGDEPQPDVLAIVKRGSYILAGTWYGGVWQRQIAPEASSWAQLGSLPPNFDSIRAMAVSSDYTYAAESRGQVWRLPSGSSTTWEEIDRLLPSESEDRTKFVFVDTDDELYGGVESLGVYEYVGSWQAMGNLGGRDALVMDYGPDGALWVGTNDGVWRWNGTDWALVWGAGNEITALKRNPLHPSELFVGLSTGAVYRYWQATGWNEVSGLGIGSGQRAWSLAFAPADMALILSLDNDPDASVSLSAGDIITYTMGYDNSRRLFVGAADGLYYTDGDTTLNNVVLKCDIPASGVVGWDPEEREETGETTHTWDVGPVAPGTGEHDFWVAVGPPPLTIPAPPGAMLVVNEGTYGTVSGTPVPSSDPVYNWIGNPHRIYLPLVMKGYG